MGRDRQAKVLLRHPQFGVSSETHLARRRWSCLPSAWREAGPPAAGSPADRAANSLLERSAVWTWSQTDQRRCGKKEKQIKPSGRRHGRSSTAHFKSLVQHSASSSSSSSSLLSSHSWASTISISSAQARQPSKKGGRRKKY